MSVRRSTNQNKSKSTKPRSQKRTSTKPTRFSKHNVIRTLIGNMKYEQRQMKKLDAEIFKMQQDGDDATFEQIDHTRAEHRFYAFESIAHELGLNNNSDYKKYYEIYINK